MPTKLTLRDILLKTVHQWPDRPALGAVGEESRTFAQLLSDAATWTTWLMSLGFKPGDRAVILAESRAEWGTAYFGITAAGYVVVPILPDFAAQQISNILTHSGSTAVVVSRKLRPVLEEAYALVPDQEIPTALLETGEILSGPGAGTTLAAPEDPMVFFSHEPEPDDPASLLYTSGTTGTSKGVMLSHNAIAWNAVTGMEEGLGPNPTGVRHLSVLPLAHTYECTVGLVGILSVGGEVRYLNAPPIPSRLLKALEDEKPSVMLTVPLLMEKIYRSKIAGPIKSKPVLKALYSFPPARKLIHAVAGAKLKKLFGGNIQFFGVGGAPLPTDVEIFMRDAKFPYSVGYGLTETAPLLAGGNTKYMAFRSTGKIVPGVDIRIHNPNSKGIGEIQAKGPNIMLGYWKDPERTAEVFTEDGYFRTGDLGMVKGDILFIKGRLKDVLLGSNGENIYPDEVESIINGQNFVAESLAYIKDGQLVARILLDAEKIAGEARKMGIQSAEKLNEWKDDLLEGIRREANRQLGRNSKIQSFIEQLKPFEKTPSLKIKRFLYI